MKNRTVYFVGEELEKEPEEKWRRCVEQVRTGLWTEMSKVLATCGLPCLPAVHAGSFWLL